MWKRERTERVSLETGHVRAEETDRRLRRPDTPAGASGNAAGDTAGRVVPGRQGASD